MGLFSKQKEEISKIDTDLIKRVANLEGKIEILEQLLKNLRGIVNKKLGNEEIKQESKDIYNNMLLPEHGV